MNKYTTILISAAFTACIIGSSCKSSDEKIKDSREDVTEAQKDLDESNARLNQALYDSIQEFRTESDLIITTRENDIAELKQKLAKDRRANKAQYALEVAKLEKKNNDMKRRLAEFRGEGAQQWKDFKDEFSHDMNELGQAINDLNKNNIH